MIDLRGEWPSKPDAEPCPPGEGRAPPSVNPPSDGNSEDEGLRDIDVIDHFRFAAAASLLSRASGCFGVVDRLRSESSGRAIAPSPLEPLRCSSPNQERSVAMNPFLSLSSKCDIIGGLILRFFFALFLLRIALATSASLSSSATPRSSIVGRLYAVDAATVLLLPVACTRDDEAPAATSSPWAAEA